MKNRQYLFSFNFEKYTQKSYITNFLKERQIDYFESKFGILYADLFGADTYYKLEAVHVCGNTFEVYYYPEQREERNGLSRRYPLIEKALKIDTPSHEVKITFENGDTLTTMINGCKDEIEEYYYNNVFNVGTVSDDIQKVVNVEFLM